MKQKVMKACLGILWAMFTLTTFLLQSCDNGKEVTPAQGSGGSPFNPQLPISVKEISPTNGAAGQKILIYGENFGNDPSLIEVTIGGQKAPVVNVQSTVIYCIVPTKAYSGEIQVTIKQGEEIYSAEVAEVKFEYQRQVVVSSLCGATSEQGSNSAKDGPFNDCGSITNPCFMTWDPEDHNLLYDAEDAGDAEGVGQGIRCFDLVALKYSVMINGVTKLIMMKSDVLDTFETIKACVAYKVNGEEIDYFPYDITEGVEPVYAELPGWQTDMTKMQSEDEFPEEFNAYLTFLEEQLGVEIKIVSVGPDRAQTIERYTEK